MKFDKNKKVINNQGDYLLDTEIYDKDGHYKGKASLSLIKLIYWGLLSRKEN